ncbi:Cyclohexa-1,5-dienecarbonyl-CoA hydratase [bacterium HR33]|nr:Cyclohexa-1,5-dienecarbonyl-CoA hydratase [bacterium HR33]
MLVHLYKADGRAHLAIDNPPLNILTRGVLSELRGALEELSADLELRAVVLEARGKHFSAGADVREHLLPECRDLIPEFVDTVAALYEFPVPLIAAVRGKCLGGGLELVLAADMVIAEEGASFGQPEIRLGVFPPVACVLLPLLAPAGAAAELLFTGEAVSAAEAKELGIVRHVVPEGELESRTLELAQRVARHSAGTLRLTKRCYKAGRAVARETWDRAARIYLDELMATEDAVAGLTAFLEKRQPVWRHR